VGGGGGGVGRRGGGGVIISVWGRRVKKPTEGSEKPHRGE